MKKIFEGLQLNDLDQLVLPLLSIDEFSSKIDDDAVVLGFYLKDVEPANDLNRFIQKGSISILDTEVSPSANDDGYYMVFVEFLRNPETPMKIIKTLKSIKSLVNIDIEDWQFTIYNHNGVFDLTSERLNVMLRTESKEAQIKKMYSDGYPGLKNL